MSVGGGEVTGIVSVATLESPLASVTRSLTTWFPGAENDVVSTGPPGWNAPLLVRAHAKAVIGLRVSVELDTSKMLWPVFGPDGNQPNDAAGGWGPGETGALTVKVTGALVPVFPSMSDCSARTV